MHDGKFFVDILDKNGQIIGQKQRKDIVKGKDIYHAVYCVLVTPAGKLAISQIAQREDLPNLHAGSYGCTAATIRRSGEAAGAAMSRALKNELTIDTEPKLLYEGVIEVDNTFRKIGIYYVLSDIPREFSKQDIESIVALSAVEFNKLSSTDPKQITPVLKLFFEKYQEI